MIRVPNNYRPQLYMGGDFGRTRNRTVLWTAELVYPRNLGVPEELKDRIHEKGTLITREIKIIQDAMFRDQESAIRSRLKCGRYMKVKLDKGAQGWTTTENLEADFPNTVEGEHLTAAYQGKIAQDFKAMFEEDRILIPDDESILEANNLLDGDPDDRLSIDLQRVDEVDTANGRPRLVTNESQTGWHADCFWAGALMVQASQARTGQIMVPTSARSSHVR